MGFFFHLYLICRQFNKEGIVPKCNMMVEADGIRKGKGAKGKTAVKKAKSKAVVEEEEDEEGVSVVFFICFYKKGAKGKAAAICKFII